MVPYIRVPFVNIALYRLTMHHSLRDRFRGTLLGTTLGETLGINCQLQLAAHQHTAHQHIAWTAVDRWGFCDSATANHFRWKTLMLKHINRLLPSPVEAAPVETELVETELVETGTVEALADAPGKTPVEANKPERLDSERLAPGHRDTIDSPIDPTIKPVPVAEHSTHLSTHLSIPAGLAIATIPIALFYHDDLPKLQHHLEQALAANPTQPQKPSSSTMGAIVVGYTIALALRETLHPPTLIPRLLTDLDIHDRDPQLAHQLTQIHNWLEQGIGLAQAKALVQDPALYSPQSTPIALAFYGFLGTPDNVRLTLLRTARLLHQPQLSCAIAGAIAGAYNSTAGLPFVWQHPFPPREPSFSGLTHPKTTPHALDRHDPEHLQFLLQQRLQHADLLLAAWSGVHTPSHWLNTSPPSAVTAAPSLIRHIRN